MDGFLEGVARSPRHTSFYLSCGPADGTPIVFSTSIGSIPSPVKVWYSLTLMTACLGSTRQTPKEQKVPVAWKSFATPVALDSNTFGYRWDFEHVADETSRRRADNEVLAHSRKQSDSAMAQGL